MAGVHVLAILYSKAGKENELRRDLTTVSNASGGEDGNIRYDLFEDASDRRRFVIVEHWRDTASQERHHNLSEHIRHFHENGDRNVETRESLYFLRKIE